MIGIVNRIFLFSYRYVVSISTAFGIRHVLFSLRLYSILRVFVSGIVMVFILIFLIYSVV